MQPWRTWNPVDQAMARLGDWLWQGRVLRRTAPMLDWVGVNYYTRIRVGWPPGKGMPPGEQTDFGWEIYPRGLYDVLRRAGRYRKPVFITENGIADTTDRLRGSYIVAHLRAILDAIRDGVDVRGYMHWSLMDNFEWAEGFEMKFGLAEMGPNLERRPRPSGRLYGEIARANTLDEALLSRHAQPAKAARPASR
jgi:beta-glucosidase